MGIVEFLRKQNDEVTTRFVAEILAYERALDGEFGCCHTAEEIGSGQCQGTVPAEIEALRWLASRFADREGYQERWKP